MSVWDIIWNNLKGYDKIFIAWIALTTVFLIITVKNCISLRKCLSENAKALRANKFESQCTKPSMKATETQIIEMYTKQEKFYILFINWTSTFPLLGMIGTIWSLLNLSLGDSAELLQSNFFVALTSTLWGAIFGLIFKIADGIINPYIEENNENYHICIERNTLDFNSENAVDKAGEKDETKQDIS